MGAAAPAPSKRSASSSTPSSPEPSELTALERDAPARVAPPAPDDSWRDLAASRLAQSWNTGQAGNPDERQYASWWARARGAGGVSA